MPAIDGNNDNYRNIIAVAARRSARDYSIEMTMFATGRHLELIGS